LQDDRVGTQRDDLTQGQTRPHARRFGLRRTQLDDFAFARRAAEHQRPAVPGGMAQYFNAQRQLRDPHTRHPHIWPGLSHFAIIEHAF
jgi:hypothetical protein